MVQDNDRSYGSHDDPTDLEQKGLSSSFKMMVIATVVLGATTVAFVGAYAVGGYGGHGVEGLQDAAPFQQVHAQAAPTVGMTAPTQAAPTVGMTVADAEVAAKRDFGAVNKETIEAEATMAKYGVRLSAAVTMAGGASSDDDACWDTFCTSCDYPGSESRVSTGVSLQECQQSCEADPQCKAIDFGKNGRANECYHNYAASTAASTPYGNHNDFDAYIPADCAGTRQISFSTSSDIEVTFAVQSDTSPTLTVTAGSFAGSWQTLSEGVKQFSDRSYTLTGVPTGLMGLKYFKGPCHSNSVSLSIETIGTVHILVSKGNGEGRRAALPAEITAPRDEQIMGPTAISMSTGSFPTPGFQRWTISPGCKVGKVKSENEAAGCVEKPWSDFFSCAEEEANGSCPKGADPISWMQFHCAVTCGTPTFEAPVADAFTPAASLGYWTCAGRVDHGAIGSCSSKMDCVQKCEAIADAMGAVAFTLHDTEAGCADAVAANELCTAVTLFYWMTAPQAGCWTEAEDNFSYQRQYIKGTPAPPRELGAT